MDCTLRNNQFDFPNSLLELWHLSTLGGAASAMGFFYEKFVKKSKITDEDFSKVRHALEISTKQLRLAELIGDPTLEGRCHLYIALGMAQIGRFRTAVKIIRLVLNRNLRGLENRLITET